MKLQQPLREATEKSLAVLSPEQRKKLPAIKASYPTFPPGMAMRRIAVPDGNGSEKAQAERAMEESNKYGSFTPQQLPVERTAEDKRTLAKLANRQFLERANLDLSDEQQKELRGFREELNEKIGQFYRELADKCRVVLTPQQMDKLREDLDRWWGQV